MFALSEIIDLAIKIEENGEEIYRRAFRETPHQSIAGMLERLADEEAQHTRWFENLREQADGEIEDPEVEEMGRTLLLGILGDQSFSLRDADFSRIDDLNALLRLSIEFEKDTVIFYEMLRAFIEDEQTLNQLKKIIEEENRHIELLQELLNTGNNLAV
jgi:rubrerythrin